MPSVLANLLVKVGVDTSDVRPGMDKATRDIRRMGREMESVGRNVTMGFTLPLFAAGGAAVKFSMDFNAAMANVATLIPGATQRVVELKGAVQDMATDVGKRTGDLAAGLYQVISAFGDTAQTIDVLRINAEAATAGLATTEQAIALTSAVTKGYGDTTAAAVQKVSDLAFQTVALGQTTFPELAQAILKVTANASTLGVTQEELFAGFSTLTGVTGDAARVATQYAAILRAMMRPTTDMAEAIKGIGFQSAKTMVTQLGMVGALRKLIEATDGSVEAIGKLFGEAESLTAVFTLLGPQAEKFNTDLLAMSTAAGSTTEAFREQAEGINKAGFQWQQFLSRMEVVAQRTGDILSRTIGEQLISALEDAAESAEATIKRFEELPSRLQQAIVMAPAAVGIAGLGILGGGILIRNFTEMERFLKGRVMPAFKGSAASARILAGSLTGVQTAVVTLTGAMAAWQVGRIVNSITDLTFKITGLSSAFDKLKSAAAAVMDLDWDGTASSMDDSAGAMRKFFDVLRGGGYGLLKRTADALELLTQEIPNLEPEIKQSLEKLVADVGRAAQDIKVPLEDMAREGADKAAVSMERLSKAWRDVKIDPGRIKELTASLRLVTAEFNVGKVSTEQWLTAVRNVGEEIARLRAVSTRETIGAVPIPPIMPQGPDLNQLFDIQAVQRATRAIDNLRRTWFDAIANMISGGEAWRRSLRFAGIDLKVLQEQVSFHEAEAAAQDLNITTTAQLREMRDNAQQAFDAISTSAQHTFTDRLRAQSELNQRTLALLRDLAANQIDSDRDVTQEKITNLESVERKNRETLNRIAGDQRRKVSEATRFWRDFGNQVSTILTDLGRNVVDIIWPRSTPTVRDVAGITDLGIRAGVSGEQLNELAAAVENLALATGQSFGTVARGAAEVFQAFDVGAAQQIPLLESLFDISVATGAGIDDLFQSLAAGADIFQALGMEVGDAAALIAKLGREGENADDIFRVLQRALDDLTTQGFAQPAEELQEIIDRIQNAGSTAEANALSIRHFGDAGVRMARLIRAGTLDVDGLADSFANAGENIEAAAQKVEEFNRQANETSKAKRLFEELGRAMLRAFVETGITKLIEKLKLMDRIGRGLKDIFTNIGKAISNIGTQIDAGVLNKLDPDIGKGLPGVFDPGQEIGEGGYPPAYPGEGGGGAGAGQAANWAQLAVSVVSLIQAHGRGKNLARIEVNTRIAAAVLAGNILPGMNALFNVGVDVKDAVWQVREDLVHFIGPKLDQIVTGPLNFNAAYVSPQLAYAGAPVLPAAAQSLRMGDTYTININGLNVANDELAKGITALVVRDMRAKGVRHRRGLRE